MLRKYAKRKESMQMLDKCSNQKDAVEAKPGYIQDCLKTPNITRQNFDWFSQLAFDPILIQDNYFLSFYYSINVLFTSINKSSY